MDLTTILIFCETVSNCSLAFELFPSKSENKAKSRWFGQFMAAKPAAKLPEQEADGRNFSWTTILRLNLKHGHMIHELSFWWYQVEVITVSRTKVHNIIWPCFGFSRKIVVRLKLCPSESCSGNISFKFCSYKVSQLSRDILSNWCRQRECICFTSNLANFVQWPSIKRFNPIWLTRGDIH